MDPTLELVRARPAARPLVLAGQQGTVFLGDALALRAELLGRTVEQFAASNRGRFFAFDNSKGVGNQEVWFLDRNR